MIKGSCWPNVTISENSHEKVMNFNFIFSHMYCDDISIDAKVQDGVRAAAFALIDDRHFELYKCRINNFFRYRDDGDIAHLPEGCCHHFVDEAARVIDCVKNVETNIMGMNIIVLLPYLKQLQVSLKILGDTFGCCNKVMTELQMYVYDLMSHCLLCADKIKATSRTLQVMNVFLDTSVLYECDLCKEASLDSRFLTPKECCQYSLCNVCCVKLWKNASTHAKCPSCSTSFKS